MARRFLVPVIVGSVLCLAAPVLLAAPGTALPPALMLANDYRPGLDLQAYWVSEKLDGVRAYWDGHELRTRSGLRIMAPEWFTAGWPDQPLDGELWAGRGGFEQVSSLVRQGNPGAPGWQALRYRVFDLPAEPGVFDARLMRLHVLFATPVSDFLIPVVQFRVASAEALQTALAEVVGAGGEGLMLHRADAPYQALRNDDLLKLKPQQDAEALVVAVLPGKGRLQGVMGALLVEMPSGQRFRLGTGFSDAERRQPPAPGTRISYRYRGLHASGLPRFASYWRQRPDGL